MGLNLKWTRRSFMGSLGVLTGSLLNSRRVFSSPYPASPPEAKITGFGATGNVYEELGVTTVINGQGTMTVLGGSLMRPEVDAVMALAGQHFVSINRSAYGTSFSNASLTATPPLRIAEDSADRLIRRRGR